MGTIVGRKISYSDGMPTQIPKFTGFEKYYEATGDKRLLNAAMNFWILNQNHTWVIGGIVQVSIFPKRI